MTDSRRIYDATGDCIGYARGPIETMQQDARLMAAAPELLALAKQYASECGECNGGGSWVELDRNGAPIPETARPCEACADICAVIAKAEPPQ